MRLSDTSGAPHAAAGLIDRLALILDWYKGMVSERTGRLAYSYDPLANVIVADGHPIREIAAIWDVERLSSFLNRADLRPLAERSLEHHASALVPRDGALVFDPARLGEPPGISHSAFMMLAFVESARPDRQPHIAGLAEGLLQQQRADGSFRTYFGGEADEGLEFYPGEAMLALMQAYALFGDLRYLTSVERGFDSHRRRMPAHAVATELRVFHANWQSQYGALLHRDTRSDAVRDAVAEYLFSLHDLVIRTHFYAAIERDPADQATVEVACALEGLNDAYAIAVRQGDSDRTRRYEQAIRTALAWLYQAQRLEHCTPRERGGFGHSPTSWTQRIDVTGHVLSGFIKTAHNRLDVPAP